MTEPVDVVAQLRFMAERCRSDAARRREDFHEFQRRAIAAKEYAEKAVRDAKAFDAAADELEANHRRD